MMRTTVVLLSMILYLLHTGQASPDNHDRMVNFDQMEHQSKMDEDEVAAGVGNRMGGDKDDTADVKNIMGGNDFDTAGVGNKMGGNDDGLKNKMGGNDDGTGSVGNRMEGNAKDTAGGKNKMAGNANDYALIGKYVDDDVVVFDDDEVVTDLKKDVPILTKDIPNHCGKCDVVMDVILTDFSKSKGQVEQLKEAIKTGCKKQAAGPEWKCTMLLLPRAGEIKDKLQSLNKNRMNPGSFGYRICMDLYLCEALDTETMNETDTEKETDGKKDTDGMKDTDTIKDSNAIKDTDAMKNTVAMKNAETVKDTEELEDTDKNLETGYHSFGFVGIKSPNK